MADPNSSSSSDFVCDPMLEESQRETDSTTGSQAIQVSRSGHQTLFTECLTIPRMLEDPSYESVVRWGNDGDSFVVLEV